ncbi:MAG: DUF4097 family beta strand repeat-containing protein [Dokdonella sp.]|uniref:DUF4097 family beta strand repeat-containing protein n=1 Tax=Dokdonella sp. TaxID=2291710 RepID=UPI00326548CF
MRRVLLLALLVPVFAFANECRFTAQRDFDVDSAGLATLAFALGSSDITVEGVPGLARIEVRAKACASDESWIAGLTVDQQRAGDRLSVTPHSDRGSNWSWFGSSYAYIDLRVRVPENLAIEINGSSSDAEVSGVASLAFDASSGDLRVRHVAGPLTIEVSSGDVIADDIGSVEIRRTSSGDMGLRDVKGDVKVGRGGSGDLQFSHIGGNVDVGAVGSGDVTINSVDRDVTIGSIGSGDVSVDAIGGNFTLRSRGSGDVRHHDVRGTVSVPHDNDD